MFRLILALGELLLAVFLVPIRLGAYLVVGVLALLGYAFVASCAVLVACILALADRR